MDDFNPSMPGRLVEIDATGHVAFEPAPLSPHIDWDATLARLIEQAAGALRLLDGRAQSLENPYILIRPMLSKEAVASNRIEGTTATIGDVLRFEAVGKRADGSDDVREVLNYLEALDYGLHRPPERPLSWSYINELHRLLLRSVRGAERQPGRIRQIQVVIGPPSITVRDRLERARFVPPPPTSLPSLLQDFETWLSRDDGNPALVRLALMHYQFETIHPYEDGNGRLGRLLITLLMKEWGVLSHPVLYLSEYFEHRKSEYIDCLRGVSQEGDWRRWLLFFLNAVKEQSQAAYHTVSQLLNLHEQWTRMYKTGRPLAHVLSVLDEFFARSYVSPGHLAATLGIQSTQAQRAIDKLAQDGIVQEVTGKKRDRIYVAPLVLAIINGEAQNQVTT
jgi:Fic family protein